MTVRVDRRSICSAVALVAALALAPRSAHGDVPAAPWFPNGPVYEMHQDGQKLYVGRRFDYAGPLTGAGVACDLASGRAHAPANRLEGRVQHAAPDGAGGWYVGGDFRTVGAVVRTNFVHLKSDGSVGPLALEPDGPIRRFEIHGGVLFIAGEFTRIAGEERSGLAALRLDTGALLPWNPAPDLPMFDLHAWKDRIYVAGHFRNIAGEPRRALAAFSTVDLMLEDWGVAMQGAVERLTSDDDRLYIAGPFYALGGTSQYYVAALDHATAAVTPWGTQIHHEYEHAPASVVAIAVSEGSVYFSGDFRWVNGQERRGLAALDKATGALRSWQGLTQPPGHVPCARWISDLTCRDGVVYAAGHLYWACANFDRAYGAMALTEDTGHPTGELINAGGLVHTFELDSEGAAFLGGEFESAGGVPRACAYAIDLSTGEATRWNPRTSGGAVLSIASRGESVYLGGEFDHVNGQQSVPYFTRVDSASGEHVGQSVWPNAPVLAMRFVGDALVVGGGFTNWATGSFSTFPRRGLVALTPSLDVLPWSCDVTGVVRDLEPDGARLVLGGSFSAIRGVPRTRVGSIDFASGVPDAWAPVVDDVVYDVHVTADRVYLAGAFLNIDGVDRNGVAAFDRGDGVLLDWNPGSEGVMRAVAESGDLVYFGGHHRGLEGPPAEWIEVASREQGVPLSWEPGLKGYVYDLFPIGERLMVGGSYGMSFGAPQPNLSHVAGPSVVDVPPVAGAVPARFAAFPSPNFGRLELTFELDVRSEVHLRLVDVRGRVQASVGPTWYEPGTHRRSMLLQGLPAGVYWVQWRGGSSSETKRVVLIDP